MRPRKPRFFAGVQLADNLYPDPRKRPGYWSYMRPDGSRRTFQADTVEEANALAEDANAARDSFVPEPSTPKLPSRGMTAFHLPEYVRYRERLNRSLVKKASWANRRYALMQFANEFPRLGAIEMNGIRTWWDTLTHAQQKLRHAEFRRFFNWLQAECLVPRIKFNPFTTNDDLPRLLLKEKPAKQRAPLTDLQYQAIYNKAGEMGLEALQAAMAISVYTLLRESDVASLRFDQHVIDDELRVVVSKSAAQKGSARATRLCWKLEKHPQLRRVIAKARELSLQNSACPFLVSHRPARNREWSQAKEHHCQVLPKRLSRMFAEVRDACGIEGPTFHEVRGLGITRLRAAGFALEQIRQIAAHEHIATTKGYMDPGALPYEEVLLKA